MVQLIEGSGQPNTTQWVFITGTAHPTKEMVGKAKATAEHIFQTDANIILGGAPGIDLAIIQTAQRLKQQNRIKVMLPMEPDEFNAYRLGGAKPENQAERRTVAQTLSRLKATHPHAFLIPEGRRIHAEEMRLLPLEARQAVHDSLNPAMVAYIKHPLRRAVHGPIAIYFGDTRGIQEALKTIRPTLHGRVYNGMNPHQNPYYPQRPTA